jgi:hypothetical protein
MALLIQLKDDIIQCIINGCHSEICDHKNGCGKFIEYNQKFDANHATPIVRLYLHLIFGRKQRIQNIINKYNDFFSDNNNINENGIKIMQKIIIEDCNLDKDWKICPQCYDNYLNNDDYFDKINYIVPSIDKCIVHQ